jgi:NAD-dependent DNA ligase
MKLQEYIEYCEKMYYEGTPVIDDEVFDRLKVQYDYVGFKSDDNKVPHAFKLYSLQKVFEGEDTPPSWAKDDACIVTPKLDGAAVSVSYHGGLTLALTRGDGKHGVDITNLVKHLVPPTIPLPFLQVVGEVVAPKSIPNARNYAAGALNLKNEQEFLSRDLVFIAHSCEPVNGSPTYLEDMKMLSEYGFETVLTCDASMYPQDGEVFRIDSNEKYQELGYTSHHPRGAFAFKTREEGVVTTLLDVEWNVGKSGAVSPVAILEPIVIDDANITRATLHNAGFIKGLGLEIGCKVEVIRSGKIIPKIVRRVE